MELSGMTKLIVCCMVIVSATVLMCMGKIPDVAGVSLLTGALGYVFGNGHGIISATKNNVKNKTL